MRPELSGLLQGNPHLWRGRETPGLETITTGFEALDTLLPGAGWPRGALVELLAPRFGMGELRLVMPAMAQLSRTGHIAWINPPFIPYAPALAARDIALERAIVLMPAPQDFLWSFERMLRVCAMVMAWPEALSWTQLRRLQLAASAGNSLGLLFTHRADVASPAALRLALQAVDNALDVTILKARGPGGHARLAL